MKVQRHVVTGDDLDVTELFVISKCLQVLKKLFWQSALQLDTPARDKEHNYKPLNMYQDASEMH